jgi:hypothetical protein
MAEWWNRNSRMVDGMVEWWVVGMVTWQKWRNGYIHTIYGTHQ